MKHVTNQHPAVTANTALNRHLKRFWLGLVIVVTAILLAPQAVAGKHHYFKHGNFCSKTSRAAVKSCAFEIKEEDAIRTADCINIEDEEERAECQVEAREERYEARKECRDQYVAREDVCDMIGQSRYDPDYEPGDFVDPADIGGAVAPNPYFPLTPGSMWVYEAEDEVITVEVTGNTKEIDGVLCAVVRDVVEEDGELVEDTLDWYAQDVDGNVWYFGEISKNYEDGELVDLDGSWKTGEDGAKAGILLPAVPVVGDVYRQEFLLTEAEDMAEVVDLTATPDLGDDNPADCSSGCLQTLEWTPVEPGGFEYKYYLPGVGMVQEEDPEGETVELVSYLIP